MTILIQRAARLRIFFSHTAQFDHTLRWEKVTSLDLWGMQIELLLSCISDHSHSWGWGNKLSKTRNYRMQCNLYPGHLGWMQVTLAEYNCNSYSPRAGGLSALHKCHHKKTVLGIVHCWCKPGLVDSDRALHWSRDNPELHKINSNRQWECAVESVTSFLSINSSDPEIQQRNFHWGVWSMEHKNYSLLQSISDRLQSRCEQTQESFCSVPGTVIDTWYFIKWKEIFKWMLFGKIEKEEE